jgi:hypothetical protein
MGPDGQYQLTALSQDGNGIVKKQGLSQGLKTSK